LLFYGLYPVSIRLDLLIIYLTQKKISYSWLFISSNTVIRFNGELLDTPASTITTPAVSLAHWHDFCSKLATITT